MNDALRAPSQTRRPLLAWMLYDVGSSTYAAVVPVVLFALHFTAVIADGRPDASVLWAITSSAALLASGIVAPIAGAWADSRRAHATLLAWFTLLCCAATAMLPLPARGELLFAAAVFVAAQVGYIVAMSIYDAYLERLGPLAGGTERLSARGWAVGFAGGIAVLLVLLALPRDARGAPDAALAYPIVAAMFASLALPAIAGLRGVRPGGTAIAAGRAWRRVAHTIAHWREQRRTMRFLIATFLINDAMVTVSVFVAIYMRDYFAMGIADVLWLTLLYHLVGLPATWIFGTLAHRTTARAAVIYALGLWIVTILLLAFGEGRVLAAIIVVMLASVLGSTQALLRGMYARIVPADRSAEFFGFNALAGRVSSAIGPLLFAAVSAATGNSRIAILSLALFLVAGGALLWRCTGPGEPGT